MNLRNFLHTTMVAIFSLFATEAANRAKVEH